MQIHQLKMYYKVAKNRYLKTNTNTFDMYISILYYY